MRNIRVLVLGFLFGIVLVKGQVISWFRINEMFRFEDPYMYLVIGSAVVVAAISLIIIRMLQTRTIDGEEIVINKKPFTKGTGIGGVIFGLGWAITGACPGPIYAQIGSGTYLAIVTFLAALTGAYFFAILQPKLPF
jgi:uncharacterized membrane protein YedE/YeeE